MHLVLNCGNERECAAVRRHGDLTSALGNGAGAVLIILDHAEQRHGDPHRRKYRRDGADMAASAVKQYQVGQTAERLVRRLVVFIMCEPAPDHLRHAGVIVRPGNRLDRKFPVTAPQRASVFKDNHSADDRVRSDV